MTVAIRNLSPPSLDRGPFVQVASGAAFYFQDPRPEEITLEDIAWSLAHLCRYNGHTRVHYSVATHSVLVQTQVPQADRAWALLHDASEAYVSDMPAPIKNLPEMKPYRDMEERVMRAIRIRFGLRAQMPESVKQADKRIRANEMRELMSKPTYDTSGLTLPHPLPLEIGTFGRLSPQASRELFLQTAREIGLQ